MDMSQMVITLLHRLQQLDTPLLLAIDGRCGSGKSTLARALSRELNCPMIPMDDFFLRPSQRTRERYAQPGENVDWERVEQEVLLPLSMGQGAAYRPFRCDSQTLGEPKGIPCSGITLVEGTYSCHSALRGYYALRVFLTTDYNTQCQRILMRNGESGLAAFQSKWIPLEEQYFATLQPEKDFDFVFHT